MKKKIFIILLFCIIIMPFNINAYCEELDPIKDPSIKTINEKYDDSREYYNEVDRYNLPNGETNNPFCQLYCRETITRDFYDTVYAMAGQSFKYDIFDNESYITASFEGTKECFTTIDYAKWEGGYKEKNKNVATTWETLKKWDALVKDSIQPDAYASLNDIILPAKVDYVEHDSCFVEDGYETRKYVKGAWETTFHPTCEASGEGDYYTYVTWQWNEYEYNAATYTWGDLGTGTSPKTKFPFSKSYGEVKVKSRGRSVSGKCVCEWDDIHYQEEEERDVDWAKKQVMNEYNAALAAYKTALTERENWIIALADCNLYTGANYGALEIKNEIGGISYDVNGRTDVRTIIIDEYPEVFASCSGDKDLSKIEESEKFKITYGDKDHHDMEYGQTPVLGYEVTPLVGTETTYCNAGNNVVKDGGYTCGYSFKKENATRKVDYIECEGNDKTSKCVNKVKEVPVNNYAYFLTQAVMDLWQDETYEVFAYSGVAKTCDSGISNNITTIPLDPYSYPISLQTPSGSYDVTTQYSCLGDMNIFRPKNIENFFKSPSPYTCNVIVDNETTLMDCDDDCCLTDTCDTPETCKKDKFGACISDGSNLELGFVFRTVNLENIFPSSRKRGKNWTTEFADKVIESSKEKASTIWSSTPEYSYVLNATNRQNIRDYNRKMETQNGNFEGVTDKVTFISSGYLSNDLTCGVEGKEFVNCKSGFLAMNNTLTGPEQFFTGGKVE